MRWLSDYVKVDATPHQFSADMTMTGSKVEGYEIEGSEIQNVVVGKVLSVVKHPNADSLVICQVDVGSQAPIQICTGATNVLPGVIVPVALDGSTLPGGKEIHKGELRGEESNGMLCSLSELGLTDHDFPYADPNGIFLLEDEEAKAPLGTDIREALGLNDVCVEFEITSNRPDCLSVIGLAREASVTYNVPLTLPEPQVKGSGGDIHDYLSVDVENPDLCPRYVAKVVKNVKVKPSPRWLRERLRASGVRPINNIVDITNYVMLEYGQPMHAFDLKDVAGSHIIVRSAAEGESLTTLDGNQRKLDTDMLVICDEQGPTGVAGVMGGENSEIEADTQAIVFESANFFGPSVRITAKKLGMRTEASGRFEKGLDPQVCVPAVLRACQLVELLDAGEVVDGMIDVDHSQKEPTKIKLESQWINRFLDIDLTKEEMISILERLGFQMEGDMIVVPSWRADAEHKADIAEEIARIYGYDKIPVTQLRGSSEGSLTSRQKFERRLNEIMLAQGLSEVITYSFISPKYYDNICLPKDSPLRRSVTILNPLGEDTSVMRTTTIPSMMEVLTRNYNYRNLSASLYELATEYIPRGENELPEENVQVSIGLYGDKVDFFTLKGIVETLLEKLNINDWDIAAKTDDPTFHPGRCAVITIDGQVLGTIGEIHPKVCENYGIGARCYVAKLSVDLLEQAAQGETQYQPLPKFPATQRDIALLCDEGLPVLTMEKAIKAIEGSILEKVELFDVYQGSQIPEGKKSVAFNLVLRHKDRTLTDEEADSCVQKALAALEKLGATLRA